MPIATIEMETEMKPINILTLPSRPGWSSEPSLMSASLTVPTDPVPPPRPALLERPAPNRAYGPPPPYNPHATPPWVERLPFRETQMHRGLYSTPLKLDNP